MNLTKRYFYQSFWAMKPRTYKLYCSIAGHAEAGMVGKLIVNP